MHSIARLLLASALALAGCTASSGGDDRASSAQDLTAYDAVVAHGTRVDTDATVTDKQSASTHVVGYLKKREVDAAATQVLAIAHWTDIRDADGSQPFTTTRSTSDKTVDATRTVKGQVTMSNGVSISVACTAKTADDGTVSVHIVNTTGYSHWLVGDVLQPGGLVIDAKLLGYDDDGVIFDGTMRVKLLAMEDRASEVTTTLASIFAWLDASTPRNP